MVLMLVSEQCYVPIFVTRVYDSIPIWPLTQLGIYILFTFTLTHPAVIVTVVLKILVWTWFLWIEIKIKNNIIREELPYTLRQPRTV